ncbi:hypothetical protein KIPB_001672 [Kipferlia bialata]|uniref:Uncharacterized protein n=1 Tax=Kipferlia bialata TaxID=797122 RepID=A0A9K3CQY8_9EUKA|nr:hypothetical protein KIPB_001672 [Kipferlia bialata]|eukprot:g1672.t1
MHDCYVVEEADSDIDEDIVYPSVGEEEYEDEWTEEHEMLARTYETTGVIPKVFCSPFEAKVLRRLGLQVLKSKDVHAYFSYFVAEGILFETQQETARHYSFDLSPSSEQWKGIYAAIRRGKELGFHRLSRYSAVSLSLSISVV